MTALIAQCGLSCRLFKKNMQTKQNQLWIIDIDGTIVNVHSNQVPAWLNMFRDVYGVTMDETTLVTFFGKPFTSVLVEALSHAGLSEAEVLTRYDQAFAGYVKGVQDGLDKNGGSILPGALNLLEELGKRKILRAISTGNPEDEAIHKLRFFNLLKYFEIMVFAGDRRERFELVEEVLRRADKEYGVSVQGKQVHIIGDSPHDIVSAKKIGAVSVAVSTGPTPYETLARSKPDLIYRSLEDYQGIIREASEIR